MTVKLTDAQLVMMSAAAQREDRCLSVPATMRGAVVGKVAAKLVKLGLVCEIPAKAGMPVWRRGNARQGYALKLTAAGLKTIVVEGGSEEAIEPSETAQLQPLREAKNLSRPDDVGERAALRDGSKLALVIDLLRRADGATIVDLSEATGWLPDTTRAALTGLRKRGYAVVRERVGAGGSIYRNSGVPADGRDRTAVLIDAGRRTRACRQLSCRMAATNRTAPRKLVASLS